MKNTAKPATTNRSVEFLKNRKKSPQAIFALKSEALSTYIKNFVESSNFKQNEIASSLEMHESQVSKWLSGAHNLTLKSILKLESASPIQILNPAIWGPVAPGLIGTSYDNLIPMLSEVPKEIETNNNGSQQGKLVIMTSSFTTPLNELANAK